MSAAWLFTGEGRNTVENGSNNGGDDVLKAYLDIAPKRNIMVLVLVSSWKRSQPG